MLTYFELSWYLETNKNLMLLMLLRETKHNKKQS